MAYAFIRDVPGNAAIYQQIKDELGEEPPGLIARVVTVIPGGLRHLQVWDSQQVWERYRDERIGPAVAAVLARLGIQPGPDDVRFEQVELFDIATGAAPAFSVGSNSTSS